MQILIAEDERDLANSLYKHFTALGNTVTLAFDGEQVLWVLKEKKFDILLLDWRMPRLTGMDVCKKLRTEGNTIPIILLTALNDIRNKIEALNYGADDYITKPFVLDEVIARINAVVRRSQIHIRSLSFYNFQLDLVSHVVSDGQNEMKLTEKEFELLRHFILNKNTIISKEQLAQDVWKLNFYPTTNYIEATVKNLRKKLEEFTQCNFIKTVYGEGYIFIEE